MSNPRVAAVVLTLAALTACSTSASSPTCDRRAVCQAMMAVAIAADVDVCVSQFETRDASQCANWAGFEPCVCACDRANLGPFEACAAACMRTYCRTDAGASDGGP